MRQANPNADPCRGRVSSRTHRCGLLKCCDRRHRALWSSVLRISTVKRNSGNLTQYLLGGRMFSLSRRASSTFGSRDGGTARLLWMVIEMYRLWLSTMGGWRISLNPSGHIHQPVSDQGGLIPSLVFNEKSTDFSVYFCPSDIQELKAKFNMSLHLKWKSQLNKAKTVCWHERAWRMLLWCVRCADLLLNQIWKSVNLVSSRSLLICGEKTLATLAFLPSHHTFFSVLIKRKQADLKSIFQDVLTYDVSCWRGSWWACLYEKLSVISCLLIFTWKVCSN